MHDYIVEPDAIPWREGQVAGITFKCQVLLSGTEGGPEALRFRFDPHPSVFAHMHLTSQFQLLLQGRMDFPKSTMKLRSLAVHYTDHNYPYGPFAVAEGHEMLVLHPKQGGLISMADRDARRQINLMGRHLYGAAAAIEWTRMSEFGGLRCKPLIPPASGPYAVMLECPPHTLLDLPAALDGRYEVVLTGSASIADRWLLPPGFRYISQSINDRGISTPLKAGPDGATLMLLAFDRDAREGGLTGEGLSIAAAAAMERAI
ncbi:MAG TPA: hypothetical protein VHY56_14440 [Candidatus Binataceae bacterium]|nr:hypothetical protein [Candidatus Binataceae bacterium]